MFPDRFNLARYLLDDNLDAGRGDKIALRWRDESFTYAQLVERSGRLARAFRELGLRMEERVLFVCSDRPEFVEAWFATLKAGAVFAMVNPLQDDEALHYALQYTRARIAVIDAELSERFGKLAAKAPHLAAVVVCGGETTTSRPELASPMQHRLADLVAGAPAADATADTHRHDVAGWLFTSGSTGHPKAAVHFHEDYAYNVEHYAKGVLGIREDDVTAGVPKLFFGYATGTQLMFPFAVGATTALFSERSTPEVICDVVERYRPTILTSVPTMIGRMLALEAEHGARDLSSLRLVLSAGEKLPEALQRQWLERCGVEILDGIGSAELFHIYISNRPGQVRPGSLGLAVPGYDCRVVDEQGADLPRGEIGRLFVRGRSAAQGYWHDREKSIATFAGELVMTADLFRQDAEGWFFFEGRADELLKVGGRFVAPHEVEDALLAHPSVAEAAVIGWKDADDLVKPRAYVVPASGVDGDETLERELQTWVKEQLAPHKYPRKVTFVAELPKNDRGKVDRKTLRARQDAGDE
ncbi:MAG: benzoate-CoA ligase family protein [Planctomycetes bacterium]|nr:benzoate-CoA ligase family protein [Planctomycetota bacterium]